MSETNPYVMFTPEGYRVEYLLITPEIAKELLDANTNNRNVRKQNLNNIQDDMRNNRWVFNGDAIRMDNNGVIIDGQHRLLAVEKTGVTISCLLITNLPPEARGTIDGPARRTPADELKMLGYTNAHELAAITKAMIRYQRKGLEAGVDQQNGKSRTLPMTTGMVVTEVKNNPVIEELTHTSSRRKYKNITKTIGAILYFVFSNLPDDHAVQDADYFFLHLRDGANLSSDSPILKLRNTLDKLYNKKIVKPSDTYTAAITIKAWNAFRTGTTIKGLSYRQGGTSPEAFPEPI